MRVIDQLLDLAVGCRHRHWAKRTRIAAGTNINFVVEDYTASNEIPDEDIDKVGVIRAVADDWFGPAPACCRCIILNEDWELGSTTTASA